MILKYFRQKLAKNLAILTKNTAISCPNRYVHIEYIRIDVQRAFLNRRLGRNFAPIYFSHRHINPFKNFSLVSLFEASLKSDPKDRCFRWCLLGIGNIGMYGVNLKNGKTH
jgi:hypothetical protein